MCRNGRTKIFILALVAGFGLCLGALQAQSRTGRTGGTSGAGTVQPPSRGTVSPGRSYTPPSYRYGPGRSGSGIGRPGSSYRRPSYRLPPSSGTTRGYRSGAGYRAPKYRGRGSDASAAGRRPAYSYRSRRTRNGRSEGGFSRAPTLPEAERPTFRYRSQPQAGARHEARSRRGAARSRPGDVAAEVPPSLRVDKPSFRYERPDTSSRVKTLPRSRAPNGPRARPRRGRGDGLPSADPKKYEKVPKGDNDDGNAEPPPGDGDDGNGDDDEDEDDIDIYYYYCGWWGNPYWYYGCWYYWDDDCYWWYGYPMVCRYRPAYYYWDYFPYYWGWYPYWWDYDGDTYWDDHSSPAYGPNPEEDSAVAPPEEPPLDDETAASMEYLAEGGRHFRAGEYLEALSAFSRAKLADLDAAQPKFLYAQALFALGLYRAAAGEIRRGFELMPEWPERGGDVTKLYGDPKDFEEQLAALKVYLELSDSDEDGLLLLGYETFFSGDLFAAEQAFRKLEDSSLEANARIAEAFLAVIEDLKKDLAPPAPEGKPGPPASVGPSAPPANPR